VPEPVPGPPLVVGPEVVFRRLRPAGASMKPTERPRIVEAILDAQADAVTFLNRSLFATPVTWEDVAPNWGGPTLDWRSWPAAQVVDDWVTVVEFRARAEAGRYDVDVLIGLNGPNEPALVRFVRDHAVESLRNDQASGYYARDVQSVSADGQSVSYTGRPKAGSGEPGSMPGTGGIKHLRRLTIGQSQRPPEPWWPNRTRAW
jgi:hypothetical protein